MTSSERITRSECEACLVDRDICNTVQSKMHGRMLSWLQSWQAVTGLFSALREL